MANLWRLASLPLSKSSPTGQKLPCPRGFDRRHLCWGAAQSLVCGCVQKGFRMFRVLSVMILGLMLHFGGQNPDDELPANPEMQREELVNLEKEAARAIQTNAGTFFRRVYADDFAGTLSHGQIVNKTTFISAVQTGEVKYDGFIASDISVRLFRDAAIATCLWSARGVYKDQRFSSQMRAMHVYINTPHGWRVVSGQVTLLPPGAQQPL